MNVFFTWCYYSRGNTYFIKLFKTKTMKSFNKPNNNQDVQVQTLVSMHTFDTTINQPCKCGVNVNDCPTFST